MDYNITALACRLMTHVNQNQTTKYRINDSHTT